MDNMMMSDDKMMMAMKGMGMGDDMMMDDGMKMAMNNMMMSASKMAMMMKEKGMSEMQVMDAMKKMGSMMMDKDMMMGKM